MTEPERIRRELEALHKAMEENQCYACSHEFVDVVEKFGTNIIERAIELLTPTTIELEGGGTTWWYVCGECHGAIDENDLFCRHCGRPVKQT